MIKVYLFSAPLSVMDAGAVVFFDLLAQMSRVLAHGGMYLCVINEVYEKQNNRLRCDSGADFYIS